MDSKGYVFVKKEFKATKLWPSKQLTLDGWVDYEKEYKEALAGKPAQVMDVAVDGSGYLVIGHSKSIGTFLWSIEKEDTIGDLIPVIWKNGQLVPANMSPMEEFMYIMKDIINTKDKFNFE